MGEDILDLGEDSFCSRLGVQHHMQGTHSFPVESHILGEGLRSEKLEAFRDEVSHCPCVSAEISSRKALIGCVEEGNETVFLHDFSQATPLLFVKVEACGVVGTGV